MQKKLLSYILILPFLLLTITTKAQIQLGAGLTFGTGISKLGINARGTYEIDEKFVAAPGVNFFFKDKAVSDVTVSYFSIDLDAQYRLITIAEDVQVYPVGGLNIFRVSVNGPTGGIRFREDGMKVGLNLGLGTQIATLSNWSYFGEFKFTIGGIDQTTITAGVLYGF
ncbi:MAG: outer membrane beta-barrel protein [Bacteroidota bacterium]